MNIIWNENPLMTQVMLDEHEKKEFWYKIKIEEMQEMIISSYFHLDEDRQYYDPKRAKQELNPEYIYPNWSDSSKKGQVPPINKRVDELFKYYICDLEVNSHSGDCTCVPCSCSKCHAESLLDIDTIKGLRKHEAHAIECAFTKPGTQFPERNNQNTIHEAIHNLEQWIPTIQWEGAEANFQRWIDEHARATTWLRKYRENHFS